MPAVVTYRYDPAIGACLNICSLPDIEALKVLERLRHQSRPKLKPNYLYRRRTTEKWLSNAASKALGRRFEKPPRYFFLGDFSYGTYILHYPIIQLAVAAGFFNRNPWLALAGTVLAVAGTALLSWFFVEKPSLTHSKSRRLRQAALHQTANYPAALP